MADALVIIGNGMVGWRLCRELAERGVPAERPVIVIGDEARPAYDRIRLSACFYGSTPDDLLLANEDWYADQGFDLRLGIRVESLSSKDNTLRLADDSAISYGQLVLATGSRPFVPPIAGIEHERVRTYRTLDDVLQMMQEYQAGERVAIIGGGLLGLELAKALRDRDVAVSILERSPGLMIRQLNPVASSILRGHMERFGIDVRTAISASAIVGSEVEKERPLRLTTGDTDIDVDHVVVATGIRARDELARDAGLTCSPGGGVVVDNFLRTSVPQIFAIGECASFEGQVYGLAAPGYKMAQILAERLAGNKAAYFDGYGTGTTLKIAGLAVQTLGDNSPDGDLYSMRNGERYRQVVLRNNKLVGATVIGDWDELPTLADAVERRLSLDRDVLCKFSNTGVLFRELDGVATWPNQAVICSCLKVEKIRIARAQADGCSTVDEIGAAVGAGTVCGSCKPLVAELLGVEPEEDQLIGRQPVLKWLGLSVLLVPVALLLFDLPLRTSIATQSAFDIFWTESFWKQVTGFTALGVSVLSLILSLRKRWRAIRWGRFAIWRLIHVIAAWLVLLLVLLHTGMRTGFGIDQLLLLGFLGLSLLGGGTAVVIAIENRVGGSAIRSFRTWTTRLHIALVWLLLPVLATHIYKVYAY